MEKINLVLGISNTSIGLVLALLALPLMKEKVKMNEWYGVKFSKSYESDELWYKINKKGGEYMFRWGVVTALLGLSCFVQPPMEGVLMWVNTAVPLLFLIGVIETYVFAWKL